MNAKNIVLRNCKINTGISRLWPRRCYSVDPFKEDVVDITSADDRPEYLQIITEKEKADILAKRNKSGLRQPDYNMIHGTRPYDENVAWFHNTIRYKKRMLGRYGMQAIDIPIGAVWPTPEEIEDKVLYEKATHAKSLQEQWKDIADKRAMEEREIREKEERITKNLGMVDKWRNDLLSRVAKKEAEILAVKEKKQRLIDEVRREFGFTIDPRDDRFKVLLEKKEKEEKKRRKEEKKKERSARSMAYLLAQSKIGSATPESKAVSGEVQSEEKKES